MTQDTKDYVYNDMKIQVADLKTKLKDPSNFKINHNGHTRSIVQTKEGDDNADE